MMGHPTWLVLRLEQQHTLNEIESLAHLTQYHGHPLPLTVGETIKRIKIMRGTLEAAFELNKLIKYSMV